MSYQVLARKYRPQRFSDVIGQDHVTRTLKNAIEQQRIAHGYIFSGHRGIGKTTIARILAMALNCRSKDHPVPEPCGICESCTEIRGGNAVDVIEIDAATNRGIDEIRELREAARYRPARDRFKIYILDEAHQITDAAFNALLKTLEEPPSHIIFMMATTQPEDIPQTIRSRCQNFSFHAVRFDEIIRNLRQIASAEGIQVDDNALAMLAEVGDGSMRDALSIMDQAIACCGERLSAATVRDLVGSVPSEALADLMVAVGNNSSQEVLELIDQLMTQGQSPMHFAKQLVRFLRNTIVAKVAGSGSSLLQISLDEAERVNGIAEKFSEEDLTRFLQIMLRTHNELGYKQEQRFHLELGLLKMVHAQRLLPLEQLLSESALSKVSTSSTTQQKASFPVTMRSAPPVSPVRTSEPPARPRGPSPFEADTARKNSGPKASATEIVSGTSAVAVAPAFETEQVQAITPLTVEPTEPSLGKLQTEILTALENARQSMLAQMMETGEWKISGTELIVTVSAKQTLIDASMTTEPRRIVTAAASKVAGQPMRVKLVSGGSNGNGNGNGHPQIARTNGDGVDARSRAQNDPIVQRMREKFGAEIRIVVDQRDKR